MTDKSILHLPDNFNKNHTIKFGAIGDLLRSDGLELSKNELFKNVSDLLFDQDVSYANFESPITRQPLVKEVIGDKAPIVECCNRDQFEVLASHNKKFFTVLNTANNHMFDMGLEGLDHTLETLAEENILNVGTNLLPEDADKGSYLTSNNIKLGFTGVTFGLNGRVLPEDQKHRINTSRLMSKFNDSEIDIIKKQIDDCKKQKCDFIIASMHWGFEFEMFPRQRQIDITHELIEYGADAIICHHPHVIQPVEYYRTKRDANRVATIAYSLGTATWGFTAPHLALSMIQNLTISKGVHESQEKTYIEKCDITPVFRSVTNLEDEILTKIEKLSDHTDGKSNSHTEEYIAALESYADLVLGINKSAGQSLCGFKNGP